MSINNTDQKFSWKTFHRGNGGSKVMYDASLNESAYVYHMLQWPFAKSIFEAGRLRLSPVRSWDDPYEKWWCDTLFGRKSSLSGIQAYGLCWTLGKYDEPRWRMAGFRRNEPIVRIRCQLRAILDAGRSLIGGQAGTLYLGKVRYRGEKRLLEAATAVNSGSAKEVTRTAASMLLHKRNAFRFESEIRLLWLDRQPVQDAFFIEIDPAAVISQIMTSPYASQNEHLEIKAFVEKYGIESKMSAVLRAPGVEPRRNENQRP